MHEPSTTFTGEEEFAARLDSLIEMEDNCDNMVVFTNNTVDQSFDLDKEDDEDDSYFAEDEFFFTGEESCFACVEPSVASKSNSTQPRELLMPRSVSMDNAKEHRASVSFGPPMLQKYKPSTTFAGEEEFDARLDSLIEMEENCDNMFIVTSNVVGRSIDHYKEFAGEESCLASVQPIISPTPNSTQPQQLLESCFAPVRTIVTPKPNSTQPPELMPRRVTMDNAAEHSASVSFGPPRLHKYKPTTTFTGEEEFAARLDSLIEMEDNCDNMVVFTNNTMDRSFDLDKEDDSYFAEDEFFFTGEESCFALVEPIAAPNPNSTQPPELKHITVSMDNAKEHRASVSFGPPTLQMYGPSTPLGVEEEFDARLDCLIAMEDNCDNMFIVTSNVVGRSFDLNKEDDEEESCLASVQPIVSPTPNSTQPQIEDNCDNMSIVTTNMVGRSFDLTKEVDEEESCLASVQPIVSPTQDSTQPQQLLESRFARVRTIVAPKPNATQPQQLLKPRKLTMDKAAERSASVSFGPPRLQMYEPTTTLEGEKEAAALVDGSSPAVQTGGSSPAVQTPQPPLPQMTRQRAQSGETSWTKRYVKLQLYNGMQGDCLVPQKDGSSPVVQTPQTPPPQITRQRPQCDETTWTMRYIELQLYNATQGDCLVPQKCKKYPRLGGWVNLQRVEYQKKRQGKKTSQMTEDRIKKLNKLGFVWDMYEAAWTERYEELVKYKGKYGDCIVPRQYKEYPKLGEWVKNQKKEYRKKSRRMTESRIADLGALGFVWEGQRHFCRDVYEAAWTERYEELVLYKGKHGDCIVPRLYKEYPKLGEWVSTQRKLYRGKSPPEINRVRFDKLEALGFAWTAAREKTKTGVDATVDNASVSVIRSSGSAR
jgi:hypothetical protein